MRKYGILAVCLALMLACACGCTAGQREQLAAVLRGTQETVDATQQQIIILQEQSAELEAQIAAMPPGEKRDRAEKLKAKVDELIVGTQAHLVKATEILDRLEAAVAGAEDELDIAQATMETTAHYLPPPWGGFLMMGGGLVIGLLRAWRNKRTAMKAIAAVDPYVSVPEEAAPEVRAAAGRAGNRLVDEAQGKTTGLPF